MFLRRSLATVTLLLPCLMAPAKTKKPTLLPADILKAQTILVVVDPDSGTDLQNSNANRTAQEDVEKALMKWGRFSLAQDAREADLIVTVRRGNGRIAQETVGGIPQNNRHAILEPTDSGVRIGARQGSSGTAGDPSNPQSPNSTSPHPELQVGEAQDAFVLYRCNSKNDGNWSPLDSPAVWRYTAKNALQAPDVPAVEAFHKLVTETEKQLAATP